jgi:hypothetical protein
MEGTTTQKAAKAAKAAYGYATLERALGKVFGVKPAAREKSFRARIIHLRRLGLTPQSGRGEVIAYDDEWAARWYLGLLLAMRLGHDPKLVAEFIKANWSGKGNLRDIVQKARAAQRPGDHVILTIDHGGISEPLVVRYVTGITGKGMEAIGLSLAGDGPTDRLVTLFDLTAGLHRLHDALAAVGEVSPPAEPPMSDAAQQIVDMGAVSRGEMTLKEFRAKHGGKRSK